MPACAFAGARRAQRAPQRPALPAGHTICWTLYLVSQHPAAMARLETELDAARLLVTPARPRPRPLAHADLGRLPYLQCVLKVGGRPVRLVRIYARTGS